jgi:hypothetical protein
MKYAIVVLVLVVLAYLVMNFNSRTADLSHLTAEHQIVKAGLDSRFQTKSALDAQIAYATSESSVYKWAYENHMIRPGDNPVVPVQSVQSTTVPASKPISIQTPLSNFEKWLMLFFDQPYP